MTKISDDEAEDDAEENHVEKGINAAQAAELRKNRILRLEKSRSNLVILIQKIV